MKRLMVLALVALALNCTSATNSKTQGHPLGDSKNPILCNMPEGERAYLNRLRCEDGTIPTYERLGSYGESPYKNILDGYEVKCGEQTYMVFMDMYHPGIVEDEAVSGFSIVE